MNLRLILLTLILISTKLIAHASNEAAELNHWNLNDVTYLFPLPTAGGIDRGLKPTDRSLLPPAIYNKLPSPVVSTKPQADWFKDFRVVGVRVDPEALQVRMVWQITHLNEAKTAFTTEDSGIHTFYSLTQTQMDSLVAGLWKLKQTALKQTPAISTDRLSLQVHPAFQHAKFADEFSRTLKNLLLERCSSKNLIQATLMQFGVPANGWWEFSGFAKHQGEWKTLTIANVDDTIQKFSNEDPAMDKTNVFPIGMRGEIVPHPNGEHMNDAIEHYHPPGEGDRQVYESAFRSLRKFQNPKLSNPNTLDCVQCHITDATQFWINSNLKNVEKPGLTDDVRFKNPDPKTHDLRNVTVTPKSTKIFRALGYWQSFPAVNQRVINETASVADYLNHTQK